MREVIITDGLWRKSLSAVRSLGKSGYNVTVFGDSIFTTSFWSCYTTKWVRCPVAKDDSGAFGSRFISFLRKNKRQDKAILLPMEDDTLNWVSENRHELSEYVDFLIPTQKALTVGQNKSDTLALAAKLGLPIPETIFPSSIEDFLKDIKRIVSESSSRNYIVKPVHGSGSSGLIYLENSLTTDWESHWAEHGALIIQERISPLGQGIGVSVLFDSQSNCLAVFVHARLQQYPNSGGPSTSRVSIKDDVLVEMSLRLLKELQWRGVAMVEWKMDPNNGVPKLMEINPRFWGSLELAVRAGVDFPLLYARAVLGERNECQKKYSIGVICRWMFPGEVLRYLTQDKNKREGLMLFLKGLPHSSEEWDRTDIRGFVSAFICPIFSLLNPKYWKYLRR